MTAQLDIFAESAEDGAIPETTWPPHYGPFRHWHIDWSSHYGPHATWEDFVACWSDQQDVEVYKDGKGFRARVHLLRDSSTGLWLGHHDIAHPTGGTSGPCSYYPAAYRTREACLEAWKVRTMELLDKYKKRHAEEVAWRKKFESDNGIHPEELAEAYA